MALKNVLGRSWIFQVRGWKPSTKTQTLVCAQSLLIAFIAMLRLRLIYYLQCVALLLVAASSAHAALTTGEKDSLAQLLQAFPALSVAQQDPNLYYLQNGASWSWPSNFDNLCLGADGYEIHGIRCSAGHVAELFLYVPSLTSDPPHFQKTLC